MIWNGWKQISAKLYKKKKSYGVLKFALQNAFHHPNLKNGCSPENDMQTLSPPPSKVAKLNF